MQIKQYNGISQKEVESKTHNIFIGISLGNRHFTLDNIKDWLDWSLKNTKEYVLLLIADELQSINYEVFEKLSKEDALKKALEEGQKLKADITNLINSDFAKYKEKIFLVGWKELKNDKYKKNIKFVLNEFKMNINFKNCIIGFVKKYLGSKTKILSENNINYLCNYLLDEIPLVIGGIQYNNILFDLNPYPGEGISKMILDIQDSKIFPELTKKLTIENKIGFLDIA